MCIQIELTFAAFRTTGEMVHTCEPSEKNNFDLNFKDKFTKDFQ